MTEAEVQAKEMAKQTYAEALERNETAFLAEESATSSDIFRCKIGNLPPDSAATLSLSYVVDLANSRDGGDNSSVVFTLPSVLNPRYYPAGFRADGQDALLTDGTAIAVEKSRYDFDFLLEVDPVFAVTSVDACGDEAEVYHIWPCGSRLRVCYHDNDNVLAFRYT